MLYVYRETSIFHRFVFCLQCLFFGLRFYRFHEIFAERSIFVEILISIHSLLTFFICWRLCSCTVLGIYDKKHFNWNVHHLLCIVHSNCPLLCLFTLTNDIPKDSNFDFQLNEKLTKTSFSSFIWLIFCVTTTQIILLFANQLTEYRIHI